jgi:hypothetical protein
MQIPNQWNITQIGNGTVQSHAENLWLTVPSSSSDSYHDAQIADYDSQALNFQNKPPLRLTIQARTEGNIQGTAGFGFWNHMFAPNERGFRVPQAVWFFFGSPPNNITLANGIAGSGWKAATFNAQQWKFYGLLPLAPIGFLLMRNKRLYNTLWPIGQDAVGVSEVVLDSALLQDFHTYTIDWRMDGATFAVDGQTVMQTDAVPTKPLGFIAWIDNQYAIVTPQGNFGWGLLDVPQSQSLILHQIKIEHDKDL